MPTLHQSLETLPHRDVRAIATRLATRQRGVHRKADWIEQIVQAWSASGRGAEIVARLSPAALAAARRLAQGGEFPAPLFLAEYGAVRRPRPGEHWTPPPWTAPQTVNEELYYYGLLAPSPPALLERAARLAIPSDLLAWFTAAGAPDHHALPAGNGSAVIALLHDVAQTLCFLLETEGRGRQSLLHGRWLAPAALAELNRRLLRPEHWSMTGRGGAPPSHARARRLRFVFFLATAAGLCADGQLTPRGWAWLAEPAPTRLIWLWNAWRTAPRALRQAYRQPTAVLPEPWPDLALRQINSLPPIFTADQLAQAVLGRETAFAAFFAAHLPDISALDAAAANLLDTLAADWGLFAPAATPAIGQRYGMTGVARWLINPAEGAAPDLTGMTQADPPARLIEQEDASWQLTVPPSEPPLVFARLAVYARHVCLARLPLLSCEGRGELTPTPARPSCAPVPASSPREEAGTDEPTPYHVYRLDATTIAAAAATGQGLPTLLDALGSLDVRLNPGQLAALQTWHARGHELQIVAMPLLRAARPEVLAQLLADTGLRAGFGELLSPTVVALTLPPADFSARLHAAGFFPQTPGTRSQEAEGRGSGGGAQRNTRRPGQSATSCQLPATSFQSLAALWLAGQLYAALGEHTALPLPPPFPDLTALLATLPPADQAVVQAQWEALRVELQALLDGRTFAPPPQPSDPERWRPLIESAIATGGSLTMRYFTAGRNLLTERTVTPYWLETHRGIPYLRADCHLAGRVRLFRLDRIQALQGSGIRGQESAGTASSDS
jgi:hypothetical protein